MGSKHWTEVVDDHFPNLKEEKRFTKPLYINGRRVQSQREYEDRRRQILERPLH